MNKIYVKTGLVALLIGLSFVSWSQIISTITGSGFGGYSGDGGPATAAEIWYPIGVTVDVPGNLYIADIANWRVRIVNTSGIINTFAGIGFKGFSGDGGPATSAEVYYPSAVAVDTFGNVYITDYGNDRVRKVNTSGIINTIAGNGIFGYSGDGGPATAAEINYPTGIAIDAFGNVYIADHANSRIRRVNTSGIISTFAGNGAFGFNGDGGQATAAEFNYLSSIAIDAFGNVFIGDQYNNRIREVNTSGIVTTVAGNGAYDYSGDGGPASAAELAYPVGIALDTLGSIYIADQENNRIRKVNTAGVISTFAGNGKSGFTGNGGLATAAELDVPTAIGLDVSQNLYIADYDNNWVRKVTSNSTGINQISSPSNEVTIYPIPTTGSFTITGITQGQLIELYNYTGQKVLSAISHQLSASFNISSMPNGIYLIRILNKDGSVFATKKIVKTGN